MKFILAAVGFSAMLMLAHHATAPPLQKPISHIVAVASPTIASAPMTSAVEVSFDTLFAEENVAIVCDASALLDEAVPKRGGFSSSLTNARQPIYREDLRRFAERPFFIVD